MATKTEVRQLVRRLPKTNIRNALDNLSRIDPAVWCGYFRKLRGWPLTFDYARQLTDVAIKQLKKSNPKGWELEYKARLLRHRPFLRQPMQDQHPHKVYIKGRQIGVSELSISEVLWFLWAKPGTKWIYTFPRDTQLKDFSATRISEAFAETPRMKTLVGVPNQVYTKRIGNSYLILRSAWESNLGEGVDADGVTFDEKDRMKDGIDIAFRESLSASRYGFLREVSTPTLPGRGVDFSWQKSDQLCWLVRCTRCSLEQEVVFPENIVQMRDIPLGCTELPEGAYAYQCRKVSCRGMLDRVNGRWVAKYPDRKNIRGYHIPQTIAAWINATKLMQKKIDYKFFQLWANYCLGITAQGENLLLSDADFQMASAPFNAITRRTSDWIDITVGIDWGHMNWVVVMARNVHNNRVYIINVGVFEDDHAEPLASVKRAESFISVYNPDVIIADGGYGKDRNAYLLKKYGPGRFYACWYNPSTKASRTFTPVWSDDLNARVLVDRTMTLKVTCRSIKEREFGMFDLEDERIRVLKQHFKNLAPLIVEEEGELVEEILASGDDHLVHATAYAWLAMNKLADLDRFNFDFM